MQLRGLLGRPKPFREIVVRPRPTATSPSAFAVAALATGVVLTATLIGVSQLGPVVGPSTHDGGRIMAVPQTPGRTSPFFGFGRTPPPPVATTPDTTTPDTTTPDTTTPDTTAPNTAAPNTTAGGVTERSNRGSSLSTRVVAGHTAPGLRYQVVTAMSAVLHEPSTGSVGNTAIRVPNLASSNPPATVVSAASAYLLALRTLAPPSTSPAVAVAQPAPQRTRHTSKHAARRGHATRVANHKRAHRITEPAKANRSASTVTRPGALPLHPRRQGAGRSHLQGLQRTPAPQS
jgi:hypothetical protein